MPSNKATTDFFLGGEGDLRPADAAVAIIVVDSRRYLMQLRDQKPNIFYPGHWGLFGGAIEQNEEPTLALKRELEEELKLRVPNSRYLTRFTFDFGRFGDISRSFYEVPISSSTLKDLALGEGTEFREFSAAEILNIPRVVPYDSFAIWLHASGKLYASQSST